ncbi:MAG: metallophosphoesterase [Bacteroidia bacterium]|nr:metallophosphoesterase [Bacteroidia bacterium]
MNTPSLVLLFFLFPASFFSSSQIDSTVIYLVGDAGNDTAPGKALLALKKRIVKDTSATIIFLGDNVYPHGMNEQIADGKITPEEKKMMAQLSVLKGHRGSVYMIPGNHDWKAQRRNGAVWIQNQEQWVNAYLRDSLKVNGAYLPSGALPGPHSVLLSPGLRLFIIDSQWFIQKRSHKKVGTLAGKSKRETEEFFWTTLEAEILAAVLRGEQLIFAAHHPLISAGTHGAPMKLVRFMVNYTPFQIFGLMGANRVLSQNVNQPGYKNYKDRLNGLLKESGKSHILVAGHDHNFQVWKMEWGTQIISGSGSKNSKFRKHYLHDPRLLERNDSDEGFTRLVIRTIDGTQILSYEFLTN